jgi:hypothetical protein
LPDRKQQSTENIRKTWQIYHRRKRGLQRDKEIHNAEIAVYHEPGSKNQEDMETWRQGDRGTRNKNQEDTETWRQGDWGTRNKTQEVSILFRILKIRYYLEFGAWDLGFYLICLRQIK